MTQIQILLIFPHLLITSLHLRSLGGEGGVLRPSLELIAISLLSILSAEIMDLTTGSGLATLSGCVTPG